MRFTNTAGRAIYAACQWGIVSLLARFGNPDLVGQYALGIAISVPILMLVPINPRAGRNSAFAADIRVMSLVFALLGIAALGFLEQSTQERLVILMVAMAQSVEWIAELYAGGRGAVSLLLHGLLSVVVLAIIVQATARTGVGLLAVLIVRLLVLFFYDFRRTPGTPRPEGGESVFDSFASSIPYYFIAHMTGYHWLGIFAALASLTPATNVLVEALGEVAGLDLATRYREADFQGFRRTSLQLAGSGLMLALASVSASILAGKFILGQLFGPQYAAQSTLLVALTAASGLGFVSHMLACILTAGRRASAQLPIDLAAIAATSIACVMLVPRLGIRGAAFASGFGVLVRITGQLWVLRSMLRHPRRSVLMSLLNDPLIPGGF